MLYWDTLHRWRGLLARSSPLPSGPPSDRLGARESGTEKLEQAIQTFRLALQENTRERSPLTWAPTQAGLDNALKLLEQRAEKRATLLTPDPYQHTGQSSPAPLSQPHGTPPAARAPETLSARVEIDQRTSLYADTIQTDGGEKPCSVAEFS